MSSVASSDSDAASTTGSTKSADSAASTVASADSGASGTSTVASSVNSADSGKESAGLTQSKLKALEEWYSGAKSSIGKYLRRRPNTPSAPPTSTQTVAEFFGNNYEGIQTIDPGPNEKTIISVDASLATQGVKTFRCKGKSYRFTWGPAAETSFNCVDHDVTNPPTMITTIDTKKTMPSLAPFLILNEPERPKKPEWYKKWVSNKMAEAAPDLMINEFDVSYGIGNNYAYERGMVLDRNDCEKYDRNDKVVLDALMKGWSHLVFTGTKLMIAVEIEGTKLNNTTAATADRLLNAGRMARTPNVPSAMGSYVTKGVYGKAINESVRAEFEKECVDRFTRALEHPDPLPVTKDGLDTYTWASVLTKAGKHLRVKGEGTRIGRVAQMRELRDTFYSKNGTGEYGDKTISFGDATKYACAATDAYHGYGNHEQCTEVNKITKRDVVESMTDCIKNGTELPQDWPRSILDIVKARDEKNAAMRHSSVKSTTPSVLNSWGGPLPGQVPAHEALTSGPNTSKSDATTGTKASLPDSLLSRVKRAGESIGTDKLNSLFRQFKPRV
jgi:hypothetical protein